MQKTEIPGIYKESTGILINRDDEALVSYRKRRELINSKENRINNMDDKIDRLSNDMNEIKLLLRKLTEK